MVGAGQPAALQVTETFKLPEAKNEAEDTVMQAYVRVSQQRQGVIPPLKSAVYYPTDHGPDFIAKTIDGQTEYFELFEIAPLRGGFENADHAMIVGDLVDFIHREIDRKVEKYLPKKEFRPISLLIYASHYAFSLGEHETKVLTDVLQDLQNSVFNNVMLIIFAEDGNPLVIRVWPYPNRNFTRSELTGDRRRHMIRQDPTLVRIIEDKSIGDYVDVTVRIPLPPSVKLSD